MLRQIQKHKTSKKSKTSKKLKSMKGGKCCKCYGGRGAWGTSCYDDPSNCCGKKTKAIRDMDKMMNNVRNRKEARKKSVITKTKKAMSSFTKSLKNMWKGGGFKCEKETLNPKTMSDINNKTMNNGEQKYTGFSIQDKNGEYLYDYDDIKDNLGKPIYKKNNNKNSIDIVPIINTKVQTPSIAALQVLQKYNNTSPPIELTDLYFCLYN